MTDPTPEYTAEIAERTVRVDWPDNERRGATPPPDGWQDTAFASQSTLHEVDEGSITGCSVLRWRDDPRSDAELIAVSLALVTGQPVPAAVSVTAPPTVERRDRYAEVATPFLMNFSDEEGAKINARELAAAVLAVADAEQATIRAAALREAADKLTAVDAEAFKEGALDWTLREAAALLRRMADEEQQPAEPEPDTPGKVVRDHVLALHQIGEQLTGIESWMWEHLAYVRATAVAPAAVPAAVEEQPDTNTPEAEPRQSCACGQDGCEYCDVDEPDDEQPEDGPRTVCVCGHTRGEHVTVSGRLLCDECDPDSTDNLICKEFEAL